MIFRNGQDRNSKKMKGKEVLFSSGNDSWSTPIKIYNDLDCEFNFDYDPCPLNSKIEALKLEKDTLEANGKSSAASDYDSEDCRFESCRGYNVNGLICF